MVDNWSGASLLPSLLYSLSAKPRQHTFVFIGFTAEEQGMVGSEFYTAQLTKQQRSIIDRMVNLDTLGLGPTKVWASHADKPMLEAVCRAAAEMLLSIGAVNFEQVVQPTPNPLPDCGFRASRSTPSRNRPGRFCT